MNVRKIVTRILAAGIVATVAMGAARADQYADIVKSGKLRVSTDFAVPPFGMLDAALQPTGLDVESAKLLAADWGLKLEWVKTTGASRIPNLLSNKADVVMSSLSITPDRAEVIDFSKPYGVINSVIGGKASDKISSWEQLKGRNVAVARGTINDTDITAVADKYGFTITRYEDDATLITAILSGQNDLIAHATETLKRINEKNPALQFEPKVITRASGIGIGVKKGNPELIEKLNAWVDANMANGKLNALSVKFTGVPLPEKMPAMPKK
ncbi:transporter substrate-binding domain-containing protein [Bosea sp. (in: a-proteobacteria)]